MENICLTRLIMMLFCIMYFHQISAQTNPVDSLKIIIFNPATSPENRKKAREEMFQIQAERNKALRAQRSQQVFLQDAKQAINNAIQDSTFRKAIDLISDDTLAFTFEKIEAISLLADWIENLKLGQDSMVEKLTGWLSNNPVAESSEKREMIQLLAKIRNPKLYPFLMDNLWALSSTDDYNNTDYWFVKHETAGNWNLFPEIIRLMATKKLEYEEGLDTISLLLDKIVQDRALLIAILNLYAQRNESHIFLENKRRIVQFLQDMH